MPNAGGDLLVNVGTLVTLNGQGSSDGDGNSITFSWSQISGPIVALSDAHASAPTFTPTRNGTYRFGLTVSDGRGGTANTSTNVVVNAVPTVSAGPNRTALANSAVILQASAFDADGDPLSYSWQRVGDPVPGVQLYQADTPSANFSPNVIGSYSFQVTVDDRRGGIAQSTVTITVVSGGTTADDHPNNFDSITDNDTVASDGTAVGAKIEYARDVDFFRLNALAGQTYEIGLVSGAGLTATTMSLSVFDPLRRLVASASSASGTVAIPQFRPQNTFSYFVQVATIGGTATGDYRVSIRGSGTVTVPLPPRLSVSFLRTGDALDATIRTSGTAVPLSALTVLLEYDSSHLTLLTALPGSAASAFNMAPQQFTLPFLGLGFQSKEVGNFPIPPGILALVSFGVKEDADRLDDDLSIGRAIATFPAGFGDAFR